MNSITQDSLALLKQALAAPNYDLAKSISTATGLVAYDLQAPAKNLYPFVTPIRNVMPRVGGGTGTATNWRQVNAIIGSGFDAMGWVPEGQRSGQMSYSTSSKSATYVTIGEEDAATFEAISAGREFEDIQARMTFRLLQKMMLKEEMAILAGNASLQLGTPAGGDLLRQGCRFNPRRLSKLEPGRRCRDDQNGHRCRRQNLYPERRRVCDQRRGQPGGNSGTDALLHGHTDPGRGCLRLVYFNLLRNRNPAGDHDDQQRGGGGSAQRRQPAADGLFPGHRLFGQSRLRLRRIADHGPEAGVKRLCQYSRDRPRGNRYGTDAFGPRLGCRDRQHVSDDVEQLRIVADRALRECPGAEKHHHQSAFECLGTVASV